MPRPPPTTPPHPPPTTEVELVHPPSLDPRSSSSVTPAITGSIIDPLQHEMDLLVGPVLVPAPAHLGVDMLKAMRGGVRIMTGSMGLPDPCRRDRRRGTRYSHLVSRNDIITPLNPSRAHRIITPSRWLHTSASRFSLTIPLPIPAAPPRPTRPAYVLPRPPPHRLPPNPSR